jgi:hypothetical protein
MNRITIAVVACTICLVGLPASASNLLTNPGFETGDFTGWTLIADPSAYGVAVAGTVIPGTYAPFGAFTVAVQSGSYAAYAVMCTTSPCTPSGKADSLTLSQTLDLVGGQTYDIGFSFGIANSPSGSYGNTSSITVGGTPISYGNYPSPVGVITYEQEYGTFTPTVSGPTTVSFLLEGSGLADIGASFDDFYVDGPSGAAPEPSSFLLMGCGLLLAAAFALRRAQAQRG